MSSILKKVMKNILPETLSRGVEDIITKEELEALLHSSRQLRIKHGIDATAPDLHIGHAASLWKLRAFQEAGHKAVILFGDVTTLIGDPTGKSKARPVVSPEEIKTNIKAQEKQVRQILLSDKKHLEIRRSSEWYGKMKIPDFLKLLSHVTHARLIERDMFQKRVRERSEIFMHELIYPILQGYDSVLLKSDCTIIGSDQLFNEHMGRLLQQRYGQKPQCIISLKIVPGLDGGEKMSKSLGNYIGVNDSPADKFGKAMRVLDVLIVPYLETYTDISLAEVRKLEAELKQGKNPMEAKMFFAEALVRRYHGEKAARAERERFVKIFSKKELSDIQETVLPPGIYNPLELLVKLQFAPSRSEARRLIQQGAVDIGGTTLSDFSDVALVMGTVIRVGKHRFVKIK